MNDFSLTVQDVGEQGVLQRVQRFCPADIVGDDAAVIGVDPGQSLVVTTDVLVDGVHFSDRTTSPEDVGWRAAAANLSDLAAMGAFPLGITVGLTLRGDVSLTWVEGLYQGLYHCLQQYDTPILGGDVCRSPVVTVSITALGQVLPQRTIRRSGARVGDALVVTGYHGASRGGLELLLHPELGQNLDAAAAQTLILAHQRPKPRLDVLPILWQILDSSTGNAQSRIPPPFHPTPVAPRRKTEAVWSWGLPKWKNCRPRLHWFPWVRSDRGGSGDTPKSKIQQIGWTWLGGPHVPQFWGNLAVPRPQNLKSQIPTGMDSSDGLADAVVQICRASGVGAEIDRNLIPIPEALCRLVDPQQALEWALYGGEDFELVLCLPQSFAARFVACLGGNAAIVGRVVSTPQVLLTDPRGVYPSQVLSLEQGFQHF
jgi:thiamine-monophosphate kinase